MAFVEINPAQKRYEKNRLCVSKAICMHATVPSRAVHGVQSTSVDN